MAKLTSKYFLAGFLFFNLITFAESVMTQLDRNFDGQPDQW
jgi:hypothetical protein